MYACTHEIGSDFSRGVRFRESRRFFVRLTPPPCHSRMALCQHTASEDSHHSEFSFTAPTCCAEQLAEALSLEGATMPDGHK